MIDSPLMTKSKAFALEIIRVCNEIKRSQKEGVLTNQLVRSGTGIGANIHEAQYAQSKKDFIAKLEIALKESNETSYWLKLMYETKRIDIEIYQYTEKLCSNIRRLLISSCTTAKENGK